MNNVGSCFSAACDWVRVRRHLAHAGGVLYGMELGSVTLKINTHQHTHSSIPHEPKPSSADVPLDKAVRVGGGRRAEFRTVQSSSRVRQNAGVPGPPTRNPSPDTGAAQVQTSPGRGLLSEQDRDD